MQVSNWFINARVRLWKPMVEEMYMEEIKEQEENNGSKDNTNTSKKSCKELWPTTNATQESSATKIDQISVLNSKTENFYNQNASPTEISHSNNSISVSPLEMKSNRESNTKFEFERNHDKNGYTLMCENENHGSGYGTIFSMEDIGRYNVSEQLAPRFHGNGVSLTLGLPHHENLPLSSTQHGFLSHSMHMGGRIEMRENENEFCGINTTPPSSHSGTSYDSVDIQNKKRFSTQLLRNFVN
ncbi:unnamed protein product [Lathyrus sativus]|nr:unnamed protein product [Lathyrus sativus]